VNFFTIKSGFDRNNHYFLTMLTIRQQIERDRIFALFLKSDSESETDSESSSESLSDSNFEGDLPLKEIWIKDRRRKRQRIVYNTVFEKRPTVLVKEAKDEEAEEAEEAEESEEAEAEESESEEAEAEESEEAEAEDAEAANAEDTEAEDEEAEESEAEDEEAEEAEAEDEEAEAEDEEAEELRRLTIRLFFAQRALREEMFFFQNMETPPSSPFR
jgi:hypothetical protein